MAQLPESGARIITEAGMTLASLPGYGQLDPLSALAVHLNVMHGLPLTLSERKAAAQRVLTSYPHWSDRSIGLIAGVSNKTVGKLRGCTTEEISQLNPRLGRDGKVRPVSPAHGRR